MNKKSIYISIYKQDYIWYQQKPDYRLTQKSSCKRLSIPKFIKKKYLLYKTL